MAAASFQLYIDKENTGQHALKQGSGQPLGVRGVGLTPSVKTFAGNDVSLSRPRSALKDVNSLNVQPSSKNRLKENLGPVQSLFKKPEPKNNDFNLQRKSEKQKSKITASEGKQRIVLKQPDPLPDIENMYIFNEREEIKPREADFTGLLGKLRNWKPPCFFGDRHGVDSDDEEVGVDDLNLTPPPDGGFDLVPIELVELEEDSSIDIPIPHIDKDLPIPYLDDSLDIEPNLGTLEIYDSSTPMKK